MLSYRFTFTRSIRLYISLWGRACFTFFAFLSWMVIYITIRNNSCYTKIWFIFGIISNFCLSIRTRIANLFITTICLFQITILAFRTDYFCRSALRVILRFIFLTSSYFSLYTVLSGKERRNINICKISITCTRVPGISRTPCSGSILIAFVTFWRVWT